MPFCCQKIFFTVILASHRQVFLQSRYWKSELHRLLQDSRHQFFNWFNFLPCSKDRNNSQYEQACGSECQASSFLLPLSTAHIPVQSQLPVLSLCWRLKPVMIIQSNLLDRCSRTATWSFLNNHHFRKTQLTLSVQENLHKMFKHIHAFTGV